jgi:hypothetical protein
MKGRHALIVSLLLAVAIVSGLIAVTRPAAGGTASASAVSDAQIAARQQQLDRWEASLREALAKRPPKLPALPKRASPPADSSGGTRVVYVRAQAPPAAAHGDDEGGEHYEADGGGHDD